MRSMLTATLIFVAAGGYASAQVTAPSAAGAKPKAAATVPVRPALQSPADTANAMAQAERQAIQSDLAWVGQYNGLITGEVSERMVAAIKEFQKDRGGRQTGVLNAQERSVLADTARRRQDDAGWKIVTDPATGARLGVPTKLAPQQSSDANGTKWSSSTGTIQIQLTRRKQDNPTTAKLAEQEKSQPAGRKVEYSAVKPDFFVLSGVQGLKKFYVRGQYRGEEVRILTILYDQATEGTVEPVVVAMSSAFNPFPTGSGPPPRKTVEYGTGVVVTDDGAIIADREITDGCLAIAIAGHGNADRVAEDKDRGLALLRIYGAHGLNPLALGSNGAANSGVELTGIADPQSQGGGAAASSVKAAVAQVGGGANNELTLSPTPALGFSGAAGIDSDGRFAGIALLKPAVVAGPANVTPTAQAVLVPAAIVHEFLRTNGVNPTGGTSDAKASVLRVICVRK
jgi:peptidoglycan hydrolase-like protein with peptidoglycan-binding domain